MEAVMERRRFGWFRREGEERALTRDNVPSVMLGGSTVAGVPVTAQTALQLVDVLSCVRVLAETACTLPLIAYRRSSRGRTRAEGRLPDLLSRPAPATTQANLVASLVGSLALRGNSFLGKFRNGEGEIEQLAILPTDRVRVEIKAGLPLYHLTHDSGRETTHSMSDVLHFKGLSLDGVMGLSPIAQAREALGLARALSDHASALVGNDSAPLGVLSVPVGPTQEDVMENLRLGFENRHRGAKNAGRVAVLSGEISFSPISLSPHDAEFVAQRKLSTQEICRLFRVPPHLVAAEGGSSLTYSNLETEGAYFLTFSLAPWLTVIEQALSADEDLCPPNVYCEFLVDGLLRTDASTRAQIFSTALDPLSGWMTRAEVRRLENLDPEREPVEIA